MMKIDYLNLLKFSVALGTAAVLSLGSAANADIFDGNLDTDGGDGVTWEDPLNWAADAVPLNNNSNILINGGHDVVYDGDTWDFLIANGLTQSATQHRVSRFLLNENTGAGPIGDNSLTFDFGDPAGMAVREVLATNTSSAIFGSRPGGTTTVNMISGSVNTGSRTTFGARADGFGVLNLTGGEFIVGRSNLHLGVTVALDAENGSGTANISGGVFRTREGAAVGGTSSFNVIGSGATEIGIGSQGSVNGFWLQRPDSVLSFAFDANGVTPILIDDVGDDGIGGAATFEAGSILELSDLGGFTQNVWVPVMLAEGGITGEPTLSAASVAAGWESRITGNVLEVQLTGTGAMKGDADLSGIVDFADIPAFISVLQSGVFQAESDCDCSGTVDFSDIPAFILILQAG